MVVRSMATGAWLAWLWAGSSGITGGCGSGAPPSPEARAEARAIWDERCTNCHGPRGYGDGPGARALPVPPRVLADSSWQGSVSDAHIATVITEGGQAVGLNVMMAANPDLKAKPDVLRALVELVRGLPG